MKEDPDISVHDNTLISYEVFCSTREMRLHTEFRDGPGPIEVTDLIFSGVVCYDFQHDSVLGTIIFDLEEVPPDDIYRDHIEEFLAGIRYGWPGDWGVSSGSAAAYFQQHGIRGFILSASCGMNGWILAREMTKFQRQPSAN